MMFIHKYPYTRTSVHFVPKVAYLQWKCTDGWSRNGIARSGKCAVNEFRIRMAITSFDQTAGRLCVWWCIVWNGLLEWARESVIQFFFWMNYQTNTKTSNTKIGELNVQRRNMGWFLLLCTKKRVSTVCRSLENIRIKTEIKNVFELWRREFSIWFEFCFHKNQV